MKVKVIIEGKFSSVWKEVKSFTFDAPVSFQLPPEQEFRTSVKGPFGIKATLIARIRFEAA